MLWISNKCKLLVIEDGNVVIVGRIMMTTGVVHRRPLEKENYHVVVNQCYEEGAMLPIPNSDDNMILVRDIVDSLIACPSHLIIVDNHDQVRKAIVLN